MQKLTALLHKGAIHIVGRDRLSFFCSNTFNHLTRRLSPFLWSFELQAQVLQRRMETPEVVSFELLPNQYWQAPQAGQCVEISYQVEGQTLERAYSISTLNPHSFWITVKRQGLVSSALHEKLQVGDILKLRGPWGQFVYQGQKSILLICAGSGITPCFAILADLLARPVETRPHIQFYAQFRQPQDTIFAETLKQIQTAGLQLDLAYSQAPAAGTLPALNAENFREVFPHFDQQDIYLCGPEGFQQTVLQALETYAYPREHLHLEHFGPPTSSPLGAELSESAPLPEVYFSPYHCRIQMRPEDRQKTLLELGLEHGLNLEKGCRKGYCGSCKLVLHAGEVQGQTQGKAVYICSAYAKSKRVVLGY
ncbi:MAG: FAD-binding oxidoreductase [Candidatus Sericytochromatia bacterium]